MEGHYCDSCKSFNTALAKKVVNTLEVITSVIKRYENQKATSRGREIIHPDLQLDMSCYMESSNNTHYQLRAIIVHKGETLTTGHCTNFIFYNKLKVEIDDRKVLISEINLDSDLSILRDGYIYIYENNKIVQNLPTQWKPISSLMIVLSSAQLSSNAKLSSLLQNYWDYPLEEALNLETLSFLLNFVTGQLLRQGCLKQFRKNSYPLDTVELVNAVLSCLDIPGERSTGIKTIEQQCCNHCKRLNFNKKPCCIK